MEEMSNIRKLSELHSSQDAVISSPPLPHNQHHHHHRIYHQLLIASLNCNICLLITIIRHPAGASEETAECR